MRVDSDRYSVQARQAIIAIPPALAARIDYSPRHAVRARPTDPALLAGDAYVGRRRLRQAVLARRRPHRPGPLNLDGLVLGQLRRLPAGTPARGSSSASSAATRRAATTRCSFDRERKACAAERSSSTASASQAAQADRLLRDDLVGGEVQPRLPGRDPRPPASCSALRRASSRKPVDRVHWAGIETSDVLERLQWIVPGAPASARRPRSSPRCRVPDQGTGTKEEKRADGELCVRRRSTCSGRTE